MSPVAIALLVAAAALVVAAEWPRFARTTSRAPRVSSSVRTRRGRRSKAKLELVRPEHEEFARSVERDLAALPTIDEHDVKRR